MNKQGARPEHAGCESRFSKYSSSLLWFTSLAARVSNPTQSRVAYSIPVPRPSLVLAQLHTQFLRPSGTSRQDASHFTFSKACGPVRQEGLLPCGCPSGGVVPFAFRLGGSEANILVRGIFLHGPCEDPSGPCSPSKRLTDRYSFTFSEYIGRSRHGCRWCPLRRAVAIFVCVAFSL